MSAGPFDDREPGAWEVAAHEAGRRSLRGVKRLIRPVWMRRLMRRNLESRESVLSAQGPALSLTTYDKRWHSVHYAIESIGSGRLRPSRLVLWVAPSLPQAGVPAPLQRLVARGLEIRTCEDVGPHTKYYPQVCQGTSALGLVTADDDVLYRADWLQTLAAAAARRPGFIHAHRIEMMSFGADGGFAPYTQWPACRGTAQSQSLHQLRPLGIHHIAVLRTHRGRSQKTQPQSFSGKKSLAAPLQILRRQSLHLPHLQSQRTLFLTAEKWPTSLLQNTRRQFLHRFFLPYR